MIKLYKGDLVHALCLIKISSDKGIMTFAMN